MKYLLDTNTIIYILEKPKNKYTLPDNFSELEKIFSFVTVIELLVYDKLTHYQQQKAKLFFKNCKRILIDDKLITKSINVRKKLKLDVTDSIIVATAMIENATLITSDKEIIKGAKTIKLPTYNILTGKRTV